MELDEAQLDAIAANPLPCIDASAARRMHEAILQAKSELDSLGAVIECVASVSYTHLICPTEMK